MKLAPLFGDHAVLQRDRWAPVWGEATPGQHLAVTLGPYTAETVAAGNGRFLTRLPPMPAGGPYQLRVRAANGESTSADDIWVGEVWVCSGQSNMQWELALTGAQWQDELARAALPGLRMLTVPRLASASPVAQVDAAWQVCSAETAGAFSAVAYHFGRRLHEELAVPVGLLNSSWGGTRIEAWISRESLMSQVDTRAEVMRYEATVNSPAYWQETNGLDLSDPDQAAEFLVRECVFTKDPGRSALSRDWHSADLDVGGWPTMPLPQTWQAAGHAGNGVLWFRRTVEVPDAWAGRELMLHLGGVDKTDITWFNGEQIGATGSGCDQTVWNLPRRYRIPAHLVKAGANTIAVRAYSFVYGGGLIGPADAMHLTAADSNDRIALAGDWHYAVEHDFGVVQPPTLPYGPGNPNSPYILFSSMIAPLLPAAIRGAIWYQGESNAGNARAYGPLLQTMIRDWRHVWGQGDFPFLTVQLANYMQARPYQSGSNWAVVRESQLRSLELPETGLAVTIDIGEANDIHPTNKRDVGGRLAQWALTRTYHREGVPSGPLFTRATIEGSSLRLRFAHVGAGLTAMAGALRTFVIAGADRCFKPAQAAIDGDTVVVTSAEVAAPLAVRYAWADNPEDANLYNLDGYPATPFRTDDW